MQITATFVVVVTIFAAEGYAAGRNTSSNMWFYRDVDRPRWCGVTTEAEARAAATNPTLASGESAWLRFSGSVVQSVILSTQSEDASVEDIYKFGPGLRLFSIDRRGHYLTGKTISVTFKPNPKGIPRLTPLGRVRRRERELAGGETYFLDWPLYRQFDDFPFAHEMSKAGKLIVSKRCKVAAILGG